MTRKVGPKAKALIHHFESCSLKAYKDAVGVTTIGWGMTYYPDGRKVQMGDQITQAQADEMADTIMRRDFAEPVNALLGASTTTPAQFGAMVALAYNIGMGNFRKSSVLRLHRAGDHAGAASAFALWNKAGGRVLPGLTRRRAAEAALYRSDFDSVERHTQGQVAA